MSLQTRVANNVVDGLLKLIEAGKMLGLAGVDVAID
jgi:hypothetical protein